MSNGDEGRSSYLDLLITTLMEHEKNMDRLLGKLEKISEGLLKVSEGAELKTEKSVIRKEKSEKAGDSDAIIYMKIKIDRPLDEVLRIIESLKE